MRPSHVWCALALALVAGGTVPAEPLVLLPLEDTTGNPGLAAAIEDEIREALSQRGDLLAEGSVRDAMRRLRIRSTGTVSPSLLDRLEGELGAGRFFSATLHQAVDAPVCEVIISARLMRAGEPALEWAGFEAASGLDDARWFGQGRLDDLEELGRRVARRVVGSLDGTSANTRGGKWRVRNVFLREPMGPGDPGAVAVIPFDSAGEQTVAGRMMTDLAQAILFRRGLRVISPGLVDELSRQRGALPRGAIDAEMRVVLNVVAGADTIFTGTVVSDGVKPRGLESEPRVGLSARLLDGRTGSIRWSGDLDASGWEHQGLFRQGRVFSEGVLSEAMMVSLVTTFAGADER